ncbi:hypothetical protein JCM10449v2_003072 [Rhodotorula kratochvilovae]
MPKKEENEENICHWLECLTQFDTAEDLFNHVCSQHIGRKSAGTLSLECKWTGCRAKASKRDHLTSHCRVHIALKPHVCNICNKAFKRPQDLKKHEKIHTEEHQAQHRVNKSTITVSSVDHAHAVDPHKAQPGQQQPVPQVAQVPYPFAFPAMAGAFPYMFAQQGQAQPAVNPQFALPGQMSQMDLACYIAFQQQLNSQAHAAATLPNMAAGLPAAYAMQLGQQAMNAQALQFLPQGAGVYPYGTAPFAFSAAPPAQAQYAAAQMPASNGMAGSMSQAPAPAGMVATPPSSSSPPQPHSLYPSLPQSLYGQGVPGYTSHQPQPPVAPQQAAHSHHHHHPPPQVKTEDIPSPAHSARSHKSHYSSSLSPGNVPALSPPSSLENSFSPSPGSDGERRALYGNSNAVAGKKRGFEEATGSFLGSLANKRFQDAESVGAQLDSLSSFLLTPELSAHALSPPGPAAANGEDSGSSSGGSEYGSGSHVFEREEVDTINQLLLSLNQNFDADLAASAVSLGDVQSSLGLDAHGVAAPDQQQQQHQHQQRHIAGLPSSSASYAPQSAASLYPNLAGSHVQRAPAPAGYPQLPTSMPMYGYPGQQQHQQQAHDAQLRLTKSVAAPTIANDYRPTQYHHVGRLQRAAPSSAHVMSIEEQVEQELLDADMEVDDEVKDAAAALLMGKSMSRAASAPARPPLPPLATARHASSDDGLRLAPINARAGSSSRLPPIRDLLALRTSESDAGTLDSPTSPVASSSAFTFSSPSASSSSSATATASSSRAGSAPLYPSLASFSPTSSSRPVSAGGVERLTHRVHKLRLPSAPGDIEHAHLPASVRESEADLSASSDEEDDDHPSQCKKSRVEAPLALATAVKAEEVDDELDLDEVSDGEAEERKPDAAARAELEARARTIAKRKAVIAYLVMYVNHKYREQLARKSMAQVRKALKKPASAAAASLGAAAQAIKEESEREAKAKVEA